MLSTCHKTGIFLTFLKNNSLINVVFFFEFESVFSIDPCVHSKFANFNCQKSIRGGTGHLLLAEGYR